jgi:alkylation response protein AidB-like acyl-CoA dehydrogenase
VGAGTVPPMSGPFSDEHEEIRRYARQWLDERAPLDEVRKVMESTEGFDPSHWMELGELGWLGMAIDETHGGAGFGFMELAVLAEEMGRSLFPSPFLSTVVMGASLVEALGTDEQRSEILGKVAGGEQRLAVAAGPAARHRCEATRVGEGWRLGGTARFVIDGHSADLLLVEATTDEGRRVFVVDGRAVGVDRRRVSEMDLTRPLAEVDFTDVGATLVGDPEASVDEAIERMVSRAIGVLTMEQVGGAQACLDMSVAYAKDRYQFGRPIGSFQAIKHMCADMLVEVESARSAAYHLAGVLDNDPEEVAVAVPLAKAYCGDAYYHAAADTIQIHGGIGFTWEHHAHLHLKRAKSGQLLFGGAAEHRSVLAGRLGIE